MRWTRTPTYRMTRAYRFNLVGMLVTSTPTEKRWTRKTQPRPIRANARGLLRRLPLLPSQASRPFRRPSLRPRRPQSARRKFRQRTTRPRTRRASPGSRRTTRLAGARSRRTRSARGRRSVSAGVSLAQGWRWTMKAAGWRSRLWRIWMAWLRRPRFLNVLHDAKAAV